jgi:hypothetical protein
MAGAHPKATLYSHPDIIYKNPNGRQDDPPDELPAF